VRDDAVAVLAGQVGEHREPGGASGDHADRRTLQADDQVSFRIINAAGEAISKPFHPQEDGRWGVKRARLQARHPVRGRAAGGATTGFHLSLKVATCDYAGRSYGWEPFSGQHNRW
jgi:hypothetical protein